MLDRIEQNPDSDNNLYSDELSLHSDCLFFTDERVCYGAAGELFSGKSYSDCMEMIYYYQSLDTNVIGFFAEPCSVLLCNESK